MVHTIPAGGIPDAVAGDGDAENRVGLQIGPNGLTEPCRGFNKPIVDTHLLSCLKLICDGPWIQLSAL